MSERPKPVKEREAGPVWGGWWFWEPPAGKAKEEPKETKGNKRDSS